MKRYATILLLGLTGCSTILKGTTQDIAIDTSPHGARCVLERNGQNIGEVPETPGTLHLDKTKYDIKITCSKKGYDDSTYVNYSGTESAVIGSVLAGGAIAWGFDSATGADNKYETNVNITLSKK